MSTALLLKERQCRSYAVQHSLQTYVNSLHPVVHGKLCQGADGHRPSIADKYVQSAEPLFGHRYQGCQIFAPGYVRGAECDLTARLSICAATAAITEYQLGLASDEDGSIHYQLARLYLKTGDTAAAAEQMQISKQLRKRWDNLAQVSLEELSTDVSRQ